MRITSVEIENFRSIGKLTMRDLGPFVVLYGPNGGGKSNILRAIDCGMEAFAAVIGAPGIRAIQPTLDDLRLGAETIKVTLEIEVEPVTATSGQRVVGLATTTSWPRSDGPMAPKTTVRIIDETVRGPDPTFGGAPAKASNRNSRGRS